MDIQNRIEELEHTSEEMHQEKKELRHEYRKQKGQLKQEYRDAKQKIESLREAAMKDIRGRIRNNMSGMIRILAVAVLVFAQFGMILLLPMFLRQYSVYFYFLLEILSVVLAIALTNASKNASFKVAWMSIALLFPISGHIMYYLWGRQKPRRRMLKKAKHRIEESYPYINQDETVVDELCRSLPDARRMSKYMSAHRFPVFKNNNAKYYSMGEYVFKDMFEDMLTAKKFLLVNFFIVAEGDIWDMLHEIMLLKVKEGVEVVFIYDDFGAMIRTDKYFAKNLNAEGIKTIVFNPIYKYTDKLIMNYRTHQKIVVIDGEIGYTGGFNIADEYANLISRFGVWKDCGIRVEGDSVWGLTMTFLQMWSMCDHTANIDYMRYKSSRVFEANDSFCHVIADGPVGSGEYCIESVYKQIIADADEKVYIMTPYLVLDDNMKQTLIEAVRRGVDVRIITPSIPDKKSVKLLTEYNYGPLLENGIRIYEYSPGFIHSKVIMNEFCSVVGTVNMDFRSFYLNYENAIWTSDKSVNEAITLDYYYTIDQSHEVTYEEWLARPLKVKFSQYVLNLVSTLV